MIFATSSEIELVALSLNPSHDMFNQRELGTYWLQGRFVTILHNTPFIVQVLRSQCVTSCRLAKQRSSGEKDVKASDLMVPPGQTRELTERVYFNKMPTPRRLSWSYAITELVKEFKFEAFLRNLLGRGIAPRNRC